MLVLGFPGLALPHWQEVSCGPRQCSLAENHIVSAGSAPAPPGREKNTYTQSWLPGDAREESQSSLLGGNRGTVREKCQCRGLSLLIRRRLIVGQRKGRILMEGDLGKKGWSWWGNPSLRGASSRLRVAEDEVMECRAWGGGARH